MLHALHAAGAGRCPPIAHLRTVNPLVVSALDAAVSGRWAMPRQTGALPRAAGAVGAAGSAAGVSAFAFQGTNAHVVLAGCRPAAGRLLPAGAGAAMPWAKQHAFVLPQPFELLHEAVIVSMPGSSLNATFQCRLSSGRLAFLWQHVVSGRSIAPAASYFEAAACAAHTLLAPSAAAGARLALAEAAIPAPLLLPAPAAGDAGVLLCTTVDFAAGTVAVTSVTGRTAAATLHMQAAIVTVAAVQAATGSTSSVNKSAARRALAGLVRAKGTAAAAPLGAVCTANLAASGADGRLFDPAALDCVLQIAAAMPAKQEGGVHVPTAVGLLLLPQSASAGIDAASSRRTGPQSTDYAMFNASGKPPVVAHASELRQCIDWSNKSS